MNDKPIQIGMPDVRSKMALKLSCLKVCDNDVDKAKDVYAFLLDGIETIPDFTPAPPSALEQFKQGTAELFGWVSNHKEDIQQGIAFLQTIRKGGSATALPHDITPIPKL